MFNRKKYILAINLRDKISPEEIPGQTVQEKAEYISEYLDKEIGEKLSSGEITIDTAYKLLAETRVIDVSQDYGFLERYRSNISNLLTEAQSVKSSLNPTGLSGEQISEIILKKLLDRAQQVFIPQLVELNRTNKRTQTDIFQQLPTYSGESKESVKQFISREIERERNEVVATFNEIATRYSSQGVTKEDLLTCVTDREASARIKIVAKGVSQETVRDLFAEIAKLKRDVASKRSGTNVWKKILSLEPTIDNKEQWESLVPSPIDWNLQSILNSAGITVNGVMSVETKQRVVNDDFRNRAVRDEMYNFFYPVLDGNGLPFILSDGLEYIKTNYPEYYDPELDLRYKTLRGDNQLRNIQQYQWAAKKNYALQKLEECIMDGYDNSRILSLIGRDSSEEVQSTDLNGKRIQFYFRSTMRGLCGSSTDEFIDDLLSLNLEEIVDIIRSSFTKVSDTRYLDMGFSMDSNEESKIINILRDDYGLDAIPYPVTVPIPEDCPTNVNSFILDFLLPADVVAGVKNGKPVIQSKVMFAGEYFGYSRDTRITVKENGKPWVTPDNSVYTAPFSKKTGEYYNSVEPGNEVKSSHIYNLRTQWKKRTYAVVGHMLGTDSLGFSEKHVKNPSNMMYELDEKNIVFNSSYCTEEEYFSPARGKKVPTCYAKKLIERLDPEKYQQLTSEEYQSNEMNDPIKMCLRVVDCAIIKIKISDGLREAKLNYIGKQTGFRRQTMQDHMIYFNGLIEQKNELLEAIRTSPEESFEEHRRLIEVSAEIKTLSNSPLAEFISNYKKILSQGELGEKLQKFDAIRQALISGTFPADLRELRRAIASIDKGILGFIDFNNQP